MTLTAVYLVLYILAASCFMAYTLGHTRASVNWLGLGVFFWSLVPLIQTINKL